MDKQVLLAGTLAAFLLAGAVAAAGAGWNAIPAFADDGEDDNNNSNDGNEREGGDGAASANEAAAAEGERGENVGDRERGEGAGAGERESEGEFGEDDDSEGAALGGGLSGLILYGVIAAVVGTIGYTAYRIFAGRKRSSVPARSP